MLIADHGEYLGEKDSFGHGISFDEPGIRIPFIIRFPDAIQKGLPSQVNSVVKMTDIFATLVDIYQLENVPDLGEGKSLLPLLINPEQEINSGIILGKMGLPGYCYRTNQYKLMYWEDGQIKFYDLNKDPQEQVNLYAKENIRANYMLGELKKWINKQRNLKKILIQRKSPQGKRKSEIDEKTLDNLKALGYIK